jgi:hypothetical protein
MSHRFTRSFTLLLLLLLVEDSLKHTLADVTIVMAYGFEGVAYVP